MKFEIVTLFPDYFSLALKQSLVGKAWEKRLFDISIVNPRDFATDKHHTADDTPFGGGGGMVMKIEPLDRCLQSLGWKRRGSAERNPDGHHLILTSAAGRPFTQKSAVRLSLAERITIVCGHYLGIDERLLERYEMDELSIGDYILTGGEPAALVMVDAIARLMPKVLGNFESALEDSYMNQLLGAPCYTRPPEYDGLTVPEQLLSGDHAKIKKFRREEAIRKCLKHRPELLESAELSDEEAAMVNKLTQNSKIER
jgi:tRNA (guanine37-N1)-methyltransferase